MTQKFLAEIAGITEQTMNKNVRLLIKIIKPVVIFKNEL